MNLSNGTSKAVKTVISRVWIHQIPVFGLYANSQVKLMDMLHHIHWTSNKSPSLSQPLKCCPKLRCWPQALAFEHHLLSSSRPGILGWIISAMTSMTHITGNVVPPIQWSKWLHSVARTGCKKHQKHYNGRTKHQKHPVWVSKDGISPNQKLLKWCHVLSDLWSYLLGWHGMEWL